MTTPKWTWTLLQPRLRTTGLCPDNAPERKRKSCHGPTRWPPSQQLQRTSLINRISPTEDTPSARLSGTSAEDQSTKLDLRSSSEKVGFERNSEWLNFWKILRTQEFRWGAQISLINQNSSIIIREKFWTRDPGLEVPLEQSNLLGSRNFHEPKKMENTSAPHIRLHHSSFSFAPMGKILEKASCWTNSELGQKEVRDVSISEL